MVKVREKLENGIRKISYHVLAHINTINHGFLMKTPKDGKPRDLIVKREKGKDRCPIYMCSTCSMCIKKSVIQCRGDRDGKTPGTFWASSLVELASIGFNIKYYGGEWLRKILGSTSGLHSQEYVHTHK